MTSEEKSDLEKLTSAITTLDTNMKVGLAKVCTTQDGFSGQLKEVKTSLKVVSENQLSCPARTGWEGLNVQVKKNEDDTKQIIIENAYKDGKGSRRTSREGKKETHWLIRQVREKFSIALMMVSIGVMTFLANTCMDNSDELRTRMIQQQAQMEHVRQEVKTVGDIGDALIDQLHDTDTGDNR